MKTILKRTSATMLFVVVMTIGLMAQAQNNGFNRCMNLPNLTDEQDAQLQDLRLERIQASQNYRNQTDEIRARQRTLMGETPISQKALDKLMDEKTTLINQHLKEGIAHRAAVNEILTEEQQVLLNQMQNRPQQYARQGAGRGAGRGYYAGQGRGGAGRGYYAGQGRGGAGKGYYAGQGRGMRGGAGRGAGRGGNNRYYRGQNW